MSTGPITILIPAISQDNQIFNLKDYKVVEAVTLTGLIHRGINLTLFKTHNNVKEKNEEATKILSYLINPCLIYDTDVFGDCILRIEISNKHTLKSTLPPRRQEQINTVLCMMKESYEEKDSKKMPDDLLKWCNNRENILMDKINIMKQEKKSVKGMEKAIVHLRESMEHYGEKKMLSDTPPL